MLENLSVVVVESSLQATGRTMVVIVAKEGSGIPKGELLSSFRSFGSTGPAREGELPSLVL